MKEDLRKHLLPLMQREGLAEVNEESSGIFLVRHGSLGVYRLELEGLTLDLDSDPAAVCSLAKLPWSLSEGERIEIRIGNGSAERIYSCQEIKLIKLPIAKHGCKACGEVLFELELPLRIEIRMESPGEALWAGSGILAPQYLRPVCSNCGVGAPQTKLSINGMRLGAELELAVLLASCR